jgi:hypothetical protein
VVIKGKSVAGAKRVADHLARTDTNERMEVKELRGVAAENMREAFREMEAVATGCPRCQRPFYHASINTRADERLTDAQRAQAIDRLEKELGLDNQPRVVVVHEKEGREHCHVVWARVNAETMRAIPDSHNYRKHELVARELEREFGHERVQGAHIEREGKERPARTPSHDEHQQAARTGIKPKAAREQLTKLWNSTDNGQAFQQALADKGWILARGDRRDFVAVDRFGGVHSLSRRIEGAKAADVRARLADVDPKTLANVADARAVQLARLSDREREAQRHRELAAQGRLKAATTPSPRQKQRPAFGGRANPTAGRAAGKVADGVAKGVGKTVDGLAGAFEGLFGGGGARKPHDQEPHAPYAPGEDFKPLDRGGPATRPDHDESVHQAEEAKTQRRQSYLRDFDREVPDETQRDADLNRSHEGGRERKRGE